MKTLQHSITDEKLKELHAKAAKLPRIKKRSSDGKYMTGAVKKIRGEHLLAAGIDRFYGSKVIESKFYRLREPVYVDHRTEVINKYRSGADNAVNAYCKKVLRTAWEQLPVHLKFIALLKTFISIITLKPFLKNKNA
jgi:hypothetical protein